MNEESEPQTFKIEVTGDNALPVFRRISELVIRDGDINRMLIEVDSEEPLVLDDYTEDVFKTGGCETDGEIDRTINFSTDSEAFALALCISNERDSWVNTGEIKRDVAAGVDIQDDRISQVLWDLAERGVLEKRPFEHDGRMKEYRITKMGRRSVEEAAA